MCSIIDANILTTEFKKPRYGNQNTIPKTAGEYFYEKVDEGRIILVVGGRLLKEPTVKNSDQVHSLWLQLIIAGLVKRFDDNDVDDQTQIVKRKGGYKSDDPHIIALAQISGARLLYSNDEKLQEDFKNKSLIDNPRGKVYSTLKGKEYTTTHRNLLARKDLCKALQ